MDLEAIEETPDDASFKIVGISLNIEGEIVRKGGSLEVFVRQTGQRFSIEGETALSGRFHLHTTLSEWDGEEARLTIEAGHGTSAVTARESPGDICG